MSTGLLREHGVVDGSRCNGRVSSVQEPLSVLKTKKRGRKKGSTLLSLCTYVLLAYTFWRAYSVRK